MDGSTLTPGFRFPQTTVRRDPIVQAEALRACAVDPAVWGDLTEPTLWGNDGFCAMSAAGQGIDGYIHMEQRLTLRGTLPLGEPALFSGETVSNEVVPRGRRIVQRFQVRRADGGVAAISEHVRLLPDPDKLGKPSARAGSVPAEDEVLRSVLAEKTMRPEDVVAYSRPVGNEIHFDPAFAARYGYRAPLAQGLMTMTWMTAFLADSLRRVPHAVLVARFRRPVFWDDALTLVTQGVTQGDADGGCTRLCALNAEGRVACDLTMEREASA